MIKYLLAFSVFVNAAGHKKTITARPEEGISQTVKVCALFTRNEKCGTAIAVSQHVLLTETHVISPLPPSRAFIGLEPGPQTNTADEWEYPTSILILRPGAQVFEPVVIISSDAVRDMALLRAHGSPLSPVVFQNRFKRGQGVRAVGNPNGYDFDSTDTVITGVFAFIRSDGSMSNLITIAARDGSVRPGYSGGAIWSHGQVIGLVELCNSKDDVCMAISSTDLERYLNDKNVPYTSTSQHMEDM